MKVYRLRKEDGTFAAKVYHSPLAAEMATEYLWKVLGEDFTVIAQEIPDEINK